MLTVIKPVCPEFSREGRIDEILEKAIGDTEVLYIHTAKEMARTDLKNRRILFAICLSGAGVNMEYYRILEYFRGNDQCLSGSVAGVIVDGGSELYTKSLARRLVFSANLSGCTFPGKPLVEATGSLYNFNVLGKVLNLEPLEVYENQVKALIDKVLSFEDATPEENNILVIHASSRKTSNSLLLWEKVASNLEGPHSVTEISLRNGSIIDCKGCRYEDCLHFGEHDSCFYGGIMVEQVYPAIIKCNSLVMICPNYNDAVSANITAFINRLTSVFRTHDFSHKKVFSIVISGYSGGDIVSEQVIDAMNMNKNFILPANFALVETANDPKSILQVEDIDEKAKAFAHTIMNRI